MGPQELSLFEHWRAKYVNLGETTKLLQLFSDGGVGDRHADSNKNKGVRLCQ